MMFKQVLNYFNNSEGVFRKEFRNQLITSLSVTIITFCHGVGFGWISPMFTKLQSPTDTPLNFTINVEEVSWIGAFTCVGGVIGNLSFGYLLDRIGRKRVIYLLAFPHILLWVLLYFATSVEWFYVSRVSGGITGGGIYVVTPIFISEISNTNIRGRLTSIFSLSLNMGILCGYVVSATLPYHIVPCMIVTLPILYLFLATRYPETPLYLLRQGQEEAAEISLKYYCNYKPSSKEAIQQFDEKFASMLETSKQSNFQNNGLTLQDFISRSALKALCSGFILMIINTFSGCFALLTYMSSVFVAVKTDLHPDTNTIIIGVVQVAGTYVASILVDRFGRKVLLILSTAGMGTGMAAFGLYAFFAQETDADMSMFSAWVPLVLMSIIIFMANLGVTSVTFVVLVEIMPVKIRSKVSSLCLSSLSSLVFILLKIYPIFMATFGVAATMWFCAAVCALGLFYISIFLPETKGKSMDS